MAKIQVDELLFECPVCIEQFDESCKMLPCQHIFCLNCLEKIYSTNEHPHCPTCRRRVMIPIVQLQRPILLLSLLEKVKAESQESGTEELQRAVDLSRETYETEKEIEFSTDHEEVFQLQLALSKSEEEAVFEAKKRSLMNEKEKLEYELTLLKSAKWNDSIQMERFELEELSVDTHPPVSKIKDTDAVDVEITNRAQEVDCASTSKLQPSCNTAVKRETDSEEDNFSDTNDAPIAEQFDVEITNRAQEVDCASTSKLQPSCNTAVKRETDSEEDNFSDTNDVPIAEQFEQLYVDATKHSLTDADLNIPDGLLSYLTLSGHKTVLKEIMAVLSDDGKFDILNEKELKHYLKIIDDYLTALTCYRRNSLTTLYDGSGDSASNTCPLEDTRNFGLLNNEFGRSDSVDFENSDAEDRELSYALELSRQSCMMEHDEDELFELTVKRSEMLSVVDKLETQLLNIKEKLEFGIVILVSAGLASLD